MAFIQNFSYRIRYNNNVRTFCTRDEHFPCKCSFNSILIFDKVEIIEYPAIHAYYDELYNLLCFYITKFK
jgi:hypothetical protein